MKEYKPKTVELDPFLIPDKEEDKPAETSLALVRQELLNRDEVIKVFGFLDLPEDQLGDIQITEAAAQRFKKQVAALRTGCFTTVPILCAGGSRCPFVSFCPLTETDDDGNIDFSKSRYPVAKQCPVESTVITTVMIDLMREYDVTEMDVTDRILISKIAEIEIQDHRLNMVLASDENQNLLKEELQHVDKQGNVFFALKEHPAMLLKERLSRQKERLLAAMVGTRKEKAAASVPDAAKEELLKKVSMLSKKLDEITSRHRSSSAIDEEPIDVEFIDQEV